MLIIVLIGFLLLAGAAILIIYRTRGGMGVAWLVAVVSAFLVWVAVLVLRWQSGVSLSLQDWRPGGKEFSTLIFQFDSISWPYAFALVSLLLGVLLTASTRIQQLPNPWAWTGSMGVTAAGIATVLAATPMAVILSWTLVDLIELGVLLGSRVQRLLTQRVVLSFSARLAGTLAVVGAVLYSDYLGKPMTLSKFDERAGIFLLLAAGLRLGVLPLHLPFVEEPPMRRGLGTVLRLVVPASGLVILGRLPPAVVSPQLAPYFLMFSSLAALYGAVMWLTAKDELAGRPYWLISLAGIAVACAVRGRPTAAPIWGIAPILAGGVLFLYSVRQARLFLIPALALLGLSGLPFTPLASGLKGLVVLPFNALDVVLIVAFSLLLTGFTRHAISEGASVEGLDRWVQVVYPLGLFWLALSFWLIGLFGWQGSLTIGNWWVSLICIILAVGLVFLMRYGKLVSADQERAEWLFLLFKPVGKVLAAVFRLDWLYVLIAFVFRLVQGVVRFLTVLLEGEGGVLWALLILTLLISIFYSGSLP
jgi:hypothetical protein